MPYTTVQVEEFFVLRWEGAPKAYDFHSLVEQLRSAHHERPSDLIYIGITPADAPPPDASDRKAMARAVPLVAAYCTQLLMVLEGSRFRDRVHRAIIAALTMTVRVNIPIASFATLAEALQASCDHERAEGIHPPPAGAGDGQLPHRRTVAFRQRASRAPGSCSSFAKSGKREDEPLTASRCAAERSGGDGRSGGLR